MISEASYRNENVIAHPLRGYCCASASRNVAEPIFHTITGLYYQEPAQVQAVYSEKYGAMCRVRKLGNGNYGVELPNGKQSIYSYEHGYCVRVVTELAGVKLSIVRKQRPL